MQRFVNAYLFYSFSHLLFGFSEHFVEFLLHLFRVHVLHFVLFLRFFEQSRLRLHIVGVLDEFIR